MNAVISNILKDRENDRLMDEFKKKQRDEAVKRYLREMSLKRRVY